MLRGCDTQKSLCITDVGAPRPDLPYFPLVVRGGRRMVKVGGHPAVELLGSKNIRALYKHEIVSFDHEISRLQSPREGW